MDRSEFVSQNVAKFMIGIADLDAPHTNSDIVEMLADQMAVTLVQMCRTIATVDTDSEEFLHIAHGAAVVFLGRFGVSFPSCIEYTVEGGATLHIDPEASEALDFVENMLKENDHGMAL